MNSIAIDEQVAVGEHGGPQPVPDAVMGFGSRLIDKSIPNAVVQREFRTEGLLCTIDLLLPADYQSVGGCVSSP